MAVENKRKQAKTISSPHGNYLQYYSDRHASGLNEDSRLKFLKPCWFLNRKCLDVGCNDGSFTRQIAKKFGVAYYLGVDIDSRLIDRAWNSSSLLDNSECCCWRREDFASEEHADTSGYDTITVFSIVKWVHLNHGDSGLVRFFAKCYRLLRPGGVFIVEPQEWASYRKNKGSSDTARLFFSEVKLRPSDFPALLTGPEVGFESCEEVCPPSHAGAGFHRSLLVCKKSKPPEQLGASSVPIESPVPREGSCPPPPLLS